MRYVAIICFAMIFLPGSIFSQFSWEHTNGPSGSILSLLNSNEKYAFIQEEDFLFRTTDGLIWEKINHAGPSIFAIYKDTLIQRLYNSSQQLAQLQISTDNGVNWFQKDLPANIYPVSDIAMSSQGIFLTQPFHSHYTLHKSIDFGETWDTIPTPVLAGGYDLEVFEDKVYVVTLTSLFRLVSTGENWEQILLPLQTGDHQYMDDFVVKDSNILFTTEDLLYFSHDDGKIWFQLDAYSRNAYDKLTLVGNDIYFQFDGNLFRSSDFGNTWDTLSTDLGLLSLLTFTGGTGVFLATSYNKGVFRWDESSETVIESNNGLSKGYIYDLSYGSGLIWAACGNDVFAYDVPSKTWSEKMNFPYPSFQYGNVSANENGWVVASSDYRDYFYYSSDHGLTWDTIHTDYYIENLQLLSNSIFITDDFKTYRSTDQGISWDTINIFINYGDFVPFRDKQYVAGYKKLYYTSDDGLTFQNLPSPIDIQRLASFEDELFGLTMDSLGFIDLYMSDDAVNWDYAGNGLPDIYGFDFFDYRNSFFFRDADHYYAFLDYDGVYWSPVDQISWSPFPSSLKGSNWLIHDDIIYLGDEGMYTSEIVNPFNTATKEISKPSTDLFSIFPNPAKDFITLQFENDIITKGIIRIYSIDGILLKTIESDNLGRSLNIPISEFSEGVYYVVFKGEQFVDVKSFVKTN